MSSYPFRAGPLFADNQWYIAAWSSEVAAQVLARTLLDNEVILYRDAAGQAVALSGVCPPPWMSLATAKLEADAVVCPYHGAKFGPDGRCVAAPLQERIPGRFALKA